MRRPHAVVALAVALTLLSVSAWSVAAEPNDGGVTGQVINKTAGGGPTGGSSVILVLFGRKEQAPLGQKTAQTDADGHYAFTGLDRDPNVVYLTVARYQNVNYPAEQPFQLQDQPTAQADIPVYESTTADDGIQLESLNLLVMGADQGVVQCMEMGALVNNTDRTFVTANPQDQQLARAIKFALPSGALGVQMQTGFTDQDVIPGVGGIQVTSPIPPGRHQFAMSFQLPYNGSSVDVSLQIPYQTGAFSVYVPDNGMRLDGSPLRAGGATQLGGQSYTLYSAANLPRATLVGGQLSGLGSVGGLPATQLAMISLGVVLFVIGGGVLLFGTRGARARQEKAPRAATHVDVDTEEERLELVVRLAALDERFVAGEINRRDYDFERERGKQRLRELILASRRTAPSEV